MRNTLVFPVVATIALLAGCSNDKPEPPAAPALAQAGITPDAPDAAAPTDNNPKQSAAGPRARLTVTNVRIGRQPGFDRVVYDLGGSGTPGWQVRYTGRAVQDGSGKPLNVSGKSLLQVRILGSAYPWDSGVTQYEGPDPLSDPSAPGITGVSSPLVYEGSTQSVIGVDAAEPPFTVTALSNPARLVVDIARAPGSP